MTPVVESMVTVPNVGAEVILTEDGRIHEDAGSSQQESEGWNGW